MHSISLVPLFDIQLFAEGGDGGAGNGNAGAGIPSTAAIAQPQTGVKDTPVADAQFVGQAAAPDAGEQTQQEPGGCSRRRGTDTAGTRPRRALRGDDQRRVQRSL